LKDKEDETDEIGSKLAEALSCESHHLYLTKNEKKNTKCSIKKNVVSKSFCKSETILTG
jgi:hypothetical protein